jgi:Uncharacterized protein conserved in bacteria with the myosin-like domain
MTEVQEPQANPYNARKPWHEEPTEQQGSAESLFLEEEGSDEATQNTAPQKQKGTNYKKRYDDLKKHYDERIAEFKQKEQELLAQAQSVQPSYQPPKSEEELEQFRTQYPDLYETVESVAHLRSQKEVQALQQKMQAIEEREAMISRREAETKLRERHPDFEDIRGDEGFHEWAKSQPDEIQNWIYNNPNNVGLASRAIDFYKMEMGMNINQQPQAQSGRQKSRQTAADMVSTKTTTVDTKQPKIWTRREIAALSMNDYDRYEQEIDQAIMEGRVVK